MSLIIGSHVSFNSKNQLVGAVNEALSYGANTFMIYTGSAQSTLRAGLSEELTYEGDKLIRNRNGILSTIKKSTLETPEQPQT